MWTLCFQQKIDLWIERVASNDNISDSPSRFEYEIMDDLEAEWCEPVWGKLAMPI